MQQSGVWWRARARADGTPLPMIPWCGSRRGDARLEARTRCGDSMCACVAWLQSCLARSCVARRCAYTMSVGDAGRARVGGTSACSIRICAVPRGAVTHGREGAQVRRWVHRVFDSRVYVRCRLRSPRAHLTLGAVCNRMSGRRGGGTAEQRTSFYDTIEIFTSVTVYPT